MFQQTADRSVMKNEGHSTLELGAITTDLRLVGKFIRLAYNGTVGQRELQKKVLFCFRYYLHHIYSNLEHLLVFWEVI